MKNLFAERLGINGDYRIQNVRVACGDKLITEYLRSNKVIPMIIYVACLRINNILWNLPYGYFSAALLLPSSSPSSPLLYVKIEIAFHHRKLPRQGGRYGASVKMKFS